MVRPHDSALNAAALSQPHGLHNQDLASCARRPSTQNALLPSLFLQAGYHRALACAGYLRSPLSQPYTHRSSAAIQPSTSSMRGTKLANQHPVR